MIYENCLFTSIKETEYSTVIFLLCQLRIYQLPQISQCSYLEAIKINKLKLVAQGCNTGV